MVPLREANTLVVPKAKAEIPETMSYVTGQSCAANTNQLDALHLPSLLLNDAVISTPTPYLASTNSANDRPKKTLELGPAR